MRILIIGAGALGGYFGARLIDNGAGVTFLLRDRRARQIRERGLTVLSPFGNTTIARPAVVSRNALAQEPVHYDAILVGCKAYDLDDTMEAFAPAVGKDTAIVPLLNGIAHLERLKTRFSEANVLGGFCLISAALDDEGTVQHLNDTHQLYFGELDGRVSTRVRQLEACFEGARCEAIASGRIVSQMWEKWVQIATAAGMTTSMRASIGTVIAAGGLAFANALFDECADVARKAGYPLSDAAEVRIRSVVTDAASGVTASMMKDIERGEQIEADHLIGEMIRVRDAEILIGQAEATQHFALLDLVSLHLASYGLRQSAEAGLQ